MCRFFFVITQQDRKRNYSFELLGTECHQSPLPRYRAENVSNSKLSEFKALTSSYELTDLYITNIPSTISSLASCLSAEEITLAR